MNLDRRKFLREVIMGIAISLLPKIIQPSTGEIEEDKSFFQSLNFVVPDYVPKLMAKYGNDEFLYLNELEKEYGTKNKS